MAGHREYNVRSDRAASQYAFENWPTPIIFSGYEIGHRIRTGPALADLPGTHIVRRAYELWGALDGRPSWDQASVLYAVRAIDNGPAAEYWELSGKGWIEVKDDGSNTWNSDPHGRHRYKIEQRPPGIIAGEIDAMMARDPQTGFRDPTRHPVSVSDTAPAAGESITVSTQLVDEEGFSVAEAGRVVQWSVTGGGKVSDEQTPTDSSGIATVTLTCSTEPWTEHVVTATDADDRTMTGKSPKIRTHEPEPVGLIAFYPLSEGEGDIAADHSGFGDPLDLQLLGGAEWLGEGNGIFVDGERGHLKSMGAAQKLHDRIGNTERFSVEVWLKPDGAEQEGPARIVSYSEGTGDRNFTLGHGQHGNSNNGITLRVRTTETNDNGQPQMNGDDALDTEIQHVVAAFDGSTLRIYRNGEIIASELRGGDLSNWDASYPLVLGAETGGQRYWAGALYRVAIYDRELTESEVQDHFEAMKPPGARPVQ